MPRQWPTLEHWSLAYFSRGITVAGLAAPSNWLDEVTIKAEATQVATLIASQMLSSRRPGASRWSMNAMPVESAGFGVACAIDNVGDRHPHLR